MRLRIELQFNTEAALDVKFNEAHVFYEIYRLMPKTSPLNAALMKKAVHQLMGQAYDRVPRPEGAAWGIKGGKKGTKSKVINGKVDLSNAEGGLGQRKQHPVPLDPTDEDQLQQLLDLDKRPWRRRLDRCLRRSRFRRRGWRRLRRRGCLF